MTAKQITVKQLLAIFDVNDRAIERARGREELLASQDRLGIPRDSWDGAR